MFFKARMIINSYEHYIDIKITRPALGLGLEFSSVNLLENLLQTQYRREQKYPQRKASEEIG